MEENNYVVYRHTSPSGKIYIGITSQKPEHRWNNREGYKNSPKFYAAIKKYGWNNIDHQILFSGLNEISAKMIEEDLIYYYKKEGISYNITDGGDGVKGFHHREETRKKISDVHKGFHHTEETKQKISTAQKCKEINQFSKNGSFIANYKSLTEAGRNTGTNIGHISQCCNGTRKSAGGFIWKFKE